MLRNAPIALSKALGWRLQSVFPALAIAASLFAQTANANLLLFPGTAQEIRDVDNTGSITVANPGVMIPGTPLNFRGEVRLFQSINITLTLAIFITKAVITNEGNETYSTGDQPGILLAIADYDFFPGIAVTSALGSVAVLASGSVINNTNAHGDSVGFKATASSFSRPAIGIVKDIELDPGIARDIDLRDAQLGMFGPPHGQLQAFLVGTTLGKFDTITLPDSAEFQASVVPEPGTMSLFGASLLGLGAILRRRRKSV